MENIIMALFAVESEAWQALGELKQNPVNDSFVISQIGLVKRENGRITTKDGFDSGVDSRDDTAIGSLVGGMVGILGGPIGVLFSGSLGALIGSTMDSADVSRNISILEKVSEKLQDGQVALLALVQEENEGAFDGRLKAFQTEILRWDAASVADEVEEARTVEAEMERLARMRLREKKKEERKKSLEEHRARIHAEMEAFRLKWKKD